MSMRSSVSFRRLIVCSVLYVLWSLMAAAVAIAANLPAGFAGLSTGLPVVRDFLYGMGTAMSPPLYALVVQLILTLFAFRRDRWGRRSVLGLAVLGLFSVIGALGEPILLEIFRPPTFDLPKALLYAGMIVLPLATLILGSLEWSGRRRDK
jgi:hypothetical protein